MLTFLGVWRRIHYSPEAGGTLMTNWKLLGMFSAFLPLVLAFEVKAQSVRQATLITSDRVKFDVRMVTPNVKEGEDAHITVTVTNLGRKPIFVVQRRIPDILRRAAEYSVEISPPYPLPLGHGDFDFVFIRVAPGQVKSYAAVIRAAAIDDVGTWFVSAGAGYVYQISDLVPRPPAGSDPAPWRHKLNTRLRAVSVGSVTVTVTDHKR